VRRALLVALLLSLLPVPASAAGPTFLGYYVEWDPRSWESLSQNWDAVDYVAAQWVWADPCGTLTTRDDQTLKAEAASRGIPVFPSLYTMSQWLNRRLIDDPAFVDRIVEYVVAEGYPGFDLDLEDVAPADREAFSALVARLAERLHAHGKLLAMAIPPKESDTRTGWAGAYDYAELGRHADIVTIMTYEYAGIWSGPGAVAPHRPVDRAIAYTVSQIPAEKVNLGVAFYGYDWNVSRPGDVRALGFPEALAIVERYVPGIEIDPAARSMTWRYSRRAGDALPEGPAAPRLRNHITERGAPPCAVRYPPAPRPPPTPAAPSPDAVEQHVVWLEEGLAGAARLDIARRHGANVAAWRLGQEDPGIWRSIRRWREGS
jgi:spore germination protein